MLYHKDHELMLFQYVEGQLGRTILKQSLAQLKEMDEEIEGMEEVVEEEEEFPPLGYQRPRRQKRYSIGEVTLLMFFILYCLQ